jgi:hypothetical protein
VHRKFFRNFTSKLSRSTLTPPVGIKIKTNFSRFWPLNKQNFVLPFRGPWAICPNSCSRKAAGDVHNGLHELSYLLHSQVAETSHWRPVNTMGKKHSLPGTATGPKVLKRGTMGGRRIDPSNGSVILLIVQKIIAASSSFSDFCVNRL